MSGHIINFHREIRKIVFELTSGALILLFKNIEGLLT